MECSDQGLYFFFLHQGALSNLWGRYDKKTLKFHRLWQIIAFSLHHKAKAHEFSSILALPLPPPPLKTALLRRGRWSFFLQLARKKGSSFFFCIYSHYRFIKKTWRSPSRAKHSSFALPNPLSCSVMNKIYVWTKEPPPLKHYFMRYQQIRISKTHITWIRKY